MYSKSHQYHFMSETCSSLCMDGLESEQRYKNDSKVPGMDLIGLGRH